MPSVVISQATTTTIIAAPSGANQQIRVTSFHLTAVGADTLTFKDTTNVALTGAFDVAAHGQLNADFNPDGYFTAVAGRGIQLVQSGSSAIGGVLTYTVLGQPQPGV